MSSSIQFAHWFFCHVRDDPWRLLSFLILLYVTAESRVQASPGQGSERLSLLRSILFTPPKTFVARFRGVFGLGGDSSSTTVSSGTTSPGPALNESAALARRISPVLFIFASGRLSILVRFLVLKRRDHGSLLQYVRKELVNGRVVPFLRRWNVLGMRSKIEGEIAKVKKSLADELAAGVCRDVVGFATLPRKGIRDPRAVVANLRLRNAKDRPLWNSGKVSGGVYFGERQEDSMFENNSERLLDSVCKATTDGIDSATYPGGDFQMEYAEAKDDSLHGSGNASCSSNLEQNLDKKVEVFKISTAPDGLQLAEAPTSGATCGATSSTSDEKSVDLRTVMTEAYREFHLANPLHSDIFNNCRQLEAEVISMVKNLFGAGCGSMTTGGTESILMAMLAYRNWGRAEKGISRPNIVAPITAHAAFDKAAHYFGIVLRKVPLRGDDYSLTEGRVHVDDIASRIDSNTVAIVGSAPNYPNGAIDPIPELSALAEKRNIGLHVDACLGGFLLPFMQEAGVPAPVAFDFRGTNTGVTSMSVDLHKYGYTGKGISLVLFKDSELRSHHFVACPDWTGGIYASPTVAGSREGVHAATSWAVLAHIGHDRYVSFTREIVTCARHIAESIRTDPFVSQYLEHIGRADTSVVCFRARDKTTVNVYAVGMVMSKKHGWNLNSLQNPASIHLCVTLPVARLSYSNIKASTSTEEDQGNTTTNATPSTTATTSISRSSRSTTDSNNYSSTSNKDELPDDPAAAGEAQASICSSGFTGNSEEHPFICDLKDSIATCLREDKWNMEAAIGVYGMTASIPESVTGDLTKVYLDVCSQMH
ncbi:unnamed protein product [Amoebophrya sp. A25]|nr:unnamed protein product [Amoebophrya sp. A25]|eukprot:GSA25T00026718001.1